MTDRRIVITGIGVVSPLGNDFKSTWEGLKTGRNGIDLIKSMDTTDYPAKIAGEVKDFDPTPFFSSPKDARRVDRYTHFAVAAAKMAVQDAGLDVDAEDKTRVGVMIGSGIGGLGTLETQYKMLLERGPGRVSPFMIPYMISNIASGIIAMEYGFGGPNMTIVTACATSNHNIGEAWRIMKFGDADVMVTGGAEATILPTGLAGFSNMKALSTRNDDPAHASRPFDVDRDGFVMGEGSGVVILETLEHAQKRGARIYGELVGYGVSSDAYHLTSPLPGGEGAARCMQMAIDHAGINP
ncbi:MAG: beta-ketoacyl-ACP synthase II, partial [Akkermansia sp.]